MGGRGGDSPEVRTTSRTECKGQSSFLFGNIVPGPRPRPVVRCPWSHPSGRAGSRTPTTSRGAPGPPPPPRLGPPHEWLEPMTGLRPLGGVPSTGRSVGTGRRTSHPYRDDSRRRATFNQGRGSGPGRQGRPGRRRPWGTVSVTHGVRTCQGDDPKRVPPTASKRCRGEYGEVRREPSGLGD